MSKLTVGLTGGICSGKSTVANLFKKLGITIIDADKIAREIVKPQSLLLKKITKKFGKNILNADQSLNRSALKKIIFQNQSHRIWLENLLHPVIIKKMIDQAQTAKSPYCILVIPLLFETPLEIPVDRILVVDTTEALQKQRLKKRDNLSEQEIQSILNAQVTRQERLAKADDVIQNFSTLESFKKQVDKLHQNYIEIVDYNIQQ